MNHIDPEGDLELGHCRTRCAACTRAADAGEMTERELRSYGLVLLGAGINQLYSALEMI